MVKRLLTNEKTIINNLSSGTYVVSIFQGGKYVTSRKMIVTNNQ
ncbi:MAG: hypothetical protein ACI95T_001487 [Flavobacteriales bacterium]